MRYGKQKGEITEWWDMGKTLEWDFFVNPVQEFTKTKGGKIWYFLYFLFWA
ncbi:hypothetical protein J7L85_03080 [candidate division WOR-3 bacterium]|nr:hypothetical protein [candidate division WOR-3 bacterium]